MHYVSTRGHSAEVTFSQAVAQGLAPDGGLYIPRVLPDLTDDIAGCAGMTYQETAYTFLRHFATDMEPALLQKIIDQSYTLFDVPEVAPLRRLDEKLFVLELFHGPTLAFKDFALQLLGNLYEEQIQRTGKPINVLGATSGDTGAAAIHGLIGRQEVNIFILYPAGGVSPLQERQMTCTGANNVHAIGIDGTFDDAQAMVKDCFGDKEFVDAIGLSAVNSINLARILAQCVYYIYGWHALPTDARDNVEFNVPTGNFGNVLAGWMVQKMGLPINSFRVATNQNDILYRLFMHGHYESGKVQKSLAPSMDIQTASNFERFLYYTLGCESHLVCSAMQAIKHFGTYMFEDFDTDTFSASRMGDAEISRKIQSLYKKYGYIADPHTACGFKEVLPHLTTVVLSTAHPAKFPDTIESAIGITPTHPSLEKLKTREPFNPQLPSNTVAGVKAYVRKHAK